MHAPSQRQQAWVASRPADSVRSRVIAESVDQCVVFCVPVCMCMMNVGMLNMNEQAHRVHVRETLWFKAGYCSLFHARPYLLRLQAALASPSRQAR